MTDKTNDTGVPSALQQALIRAELERETEPVPFKRKRGMRTRPDLKAPSPAVVRAPVTGVPHPDPLLVDILVRPRRHGSVAEKAFTAWLRTRPSAAGAGIVLKELALGSWAWEVAGAGWEDVMFSCHVDTTDDEVSCKEETARKKLVYDPGLAVLSLDASHKIGSCLGADDGVGIWIMLRMIEARVPGTYVFHRGEECGGVSAQDNVRLHAEYFKKRKMAIAFDRGGNGDVITMQGGIVCASNGFAQALATALNKDSDFDYKPHTGGSFTDTKLYRGLIGECINLSVGYADQHGPDEYLDWQHLHALLPVLLKIEWAKLPCLRQPYIAPPYTPAPPAYTRQLQDDFFGVKRTNDQKSGRGSTLGSVDLDSLTFAEAMAAVDDDADLARAIILSLMRERARLQADIAFLDSVIDDLK